jgi:hypothetical protein
MLQRTPQAFINACFSLLWNSGYSTVIDDDLSNWVAFMTEQNKNGTVNVAANPEYHRLQPDNSFWLSLRRRGSKGPAIACICDRLIETDDFVEMQRNLELWYGNTAHEHEPLEIALPRSEYPEIKGQIGHPVGLWVNPSERHSGLAWLLQRLVRAMTLARWPDVEWHCGTTLEPLVNRGIPFNTYGYTRADLLSDGYFPVTGKHERPYLTSIHRSEMLMQIADDLSVIEMNTDKQVGDVVRMIRERQGHAPVRTAMAA